MKHIILLAFLFFLVNTASAQNPCGTVIDFQNEPEPLCSSFQMTELLRATPAGGTFSGPLVSINGAVNSYGAAEGTYMVYYTAPDTCATVDSFALEVVATNASIDLFTPFDCTASAPVQGFFSAGQNEQVSLMVDAGNPAFAQNGGSADFTTASGNDIYVSVVTSSGLCEMDIEMPTTNIPTVQAEVTYDCALDRAFLTYVGPFTSRTIQWRRYEDQSSSVLEQQVLLGSPYACGNAGDYQMRVIFENGCETFGFLNLPDVLNIVPSADAGTYEPLSCLTNPLDSFRLFSSSSDNNMGYTWSTVDGSPFPGNASVREPLVPSTPATYVLQTVNNTTGCTSRPDTAVIVQATADTISLAVDICEGEPYEFNGQFYENAGSYQVTVVDTSDCSSLTNLDLNVYPLPEVTFTATGPNANGEYDVQIVSSGNESYSYTWCNGATTAAVSGLPSLDCGVTVTNNTTGCSVVENANTAVVVSATQQVIPGSFKLAPNPVANVVNWSYSGSAALLFTEVRTSTGQLIAKTPVVNTLNAQLDLSIVPVGLYTITWMDAEGRLSTRRVVKQ